MRALRAYCRFYYRERGGSKGASAHNHKYIHTKFLSWGRAARQSQLLQLDKGSGTGPFTKQRAETRTRAVQGNKARGTTPVQQRGGTVAEGADGYQIYSPWTIWARGREEQTGCSQQKTVRGTQGRRHIGRGGGDDGGHWQGQGPRRQLDMGDIHGAWRG